MIKNILKRIYEKMIKERNVITLLTIFAGLGMCVYYALSLTIEADPVLMQINQQQNMWGLVITGAPLLILVISYIIKNNKYVIGALAINLILIISYTNLRYNSGFELFNHLLFLFVIAVLILVAFIGIVINKKQLIKYSLIGSIMYLIYLIFSFINVIRFNFGTNPVVSGLIENVSLRIVVVILIAVCFAIAYFIKKKLYKYIAGLMAAVFAALFVHFGGLIFLDGIVVAAYINASIYVFNLMILASYIAGCEEGKLI